jgi:hypothetical protein
MALDHYVSQVHLKNFSSSKPTGQLNAVRKRDLHAFKPWTEDICRIDEGSTNKYLHEPRAIEDFLKKIEPGYNSALKKLRLGQVDAECIFTVAGFIAYVCSCSPTSMRLGTSPLAETLKEVARRLDASGKLPQSPPELGGKTLPELLEERIVNLTIDPKYPQAIGIRAIYSMLYTLGNFDWELLNNPFADDYPFFTSDYPIGMEETQDLLIINKVVPLAPDFAVRVRPRFDVSTRTISQDFSKLRYRTVELNQTEVMAINQLIVRCAESQVYFRNECPWTIDFVKLHAGFRIESVNHQIRTPDGGLLLISSYTVTDKRPAP